MPKSRVGVSVRSFTLATFTFSEAAIQTLGGWAVKLVLGPRRSAFGRTEAPSAAQTYFGLLRGTGNNLLGPLA